MNIRDKSDSILDYTSENNTVSRKKLYLLIATFIILAVAAIVFCVGYFTQDKVTEYDGILVQSMLTDCDL